MKRIISVPALVVLVALVASCSTPPYVHRSGEFNRQAANFGQPVEDIDSVTICYSSYSATPQQVNRLAVDECAAFGKTAEFTGQSYDACPLSAPVAATYSCRAGGAATAAGDEVVPGTAIINYDGIQFRY